MLRTIARRMALNLLRAHPRSHTELDDPQGLTLGNHPAPDPGPADILLTRAELARAYDAVLHFPVDYQRLYRLCAIDGLSASEAGTEHRLCEWHLGRKLREHLPEAILDDRGHPVGKALGDAFRSPEGWRALVEAIEREHAERSSLGLATSWLER
jgi:hypothetical protein